MVDWEWEILKLEISIIHKQAVQLEDNWAKLLLLHLISTSQQEDLEEIQEHLEEMQEHQEEIQDHLEETQGQDQLEDHN